MLTGAMRFAPYAFSAVLFAVIVPIANLPLPRQILTLTALLVGTTPVADMATCGLLVALFFVTPRKSIVVLAAVFVHPLLVRRPALGEAAQKG